MLSNNDLYEIYTNEELKEWFSQGKTLDELKNITEVEETTIKDLYNKNIEDTFIKTPQGWSEVNNKYHYFLPTYKILFDDNSEITCSENHLLKTNDNNWLCPYNLFRDTKIKSEDGFFKNVKSVYYQGNQDVYDIEVDNNERSYYANEVTNHNSGAGKSLFLANLGVNWALQGMNVMYVTLELSEKLVSMRLDSMMTEVPTREIFKNIDDVEMKVKMTKKKGAGDFQVKYMPSGTTANDIRAYVKEFENKTNENIDVLLIDYLDLLMPHSVKIPPTDMFVKDKYVSEELRNLAMEMNVIFVTASQLNRGSVEEIDFDHSHIAGGLSKIMTADNVFGIFTSRAMRERGRYQIQLMKTRNSSGIGAKVELGFDVDSLRIYTLDEDVEESSQASAGGSGQGSSMVERLKRGSNSSESAKPEPSEGDSPKVKGKTESTQLKTFLQNLENEDDED